MLIPAPTSLFINIALSLIVYWKKTENITEIHGVVAAILRNEGIKVKKTITFIYISSPIILLVLTV